MNCGGRTDFDGGQETGVDFIGAGRPRGAYHNLILS